MIHRIYVTRKLPESLYRALKAKGYAVTTHPRSDSSPSRRELLRRIRGCSAVVTLLTDRVDDEFLKAAGPQLKVVSNYAVGYDNIDLAACARSGVRVGNTPCEEVNESVSEMAMAMLMALARRLPEADAFIRAGKYTIWDPALLIGTSLMGKTLGICGLGRIGSGLARRAADGFGLKIVYTDVKKNPEFEKRFNATYLTKERLLKTADFVSLHLPLLPSTRHYISTKEFALMKPTAYLINTARGPVVDELALLKALTKKKIAGVALDVFENEPAIDTNPRDQYSLKKFRNIVMTPHIASATVEAREKMAELAVANLIGGVRGTAMPAEVRKSA